MQPDLSPSDVADVIDAAADNLWMYGRCTGTGKDDNGRLCVRGAIAQAKGRDASEPANVMGAGYVEVREVESYLAAHAAEVVPAYLAETYPDYIERGRFPSWIWNDHLRPSPENDALVIDTLRMCAKDLRNGASDAA